MRREISPLEAIGAQRLERLARIGRKEQLDRFGAARARLVVRRKFRFELRLAKAEIEQVVPDVFGELRRGLVARFAQARRRCARASARASRSPCASRSSSASRPSILRIRSAACSPKAITSANRSAVFALQGFEQGDALFELRELLRIEVELLRVTIEGARDFRQLDHGGGVGSELSVRPGSIFSSSRRSRCVSAS